MNKYYFFASLAPTEVWSNCYNKILHPIVTIVKGRKTANFISIWCFLYQYVSELTALIHKMLLITLSHYRRKGTAQLPTLEKTADTVKVTPHDQPKIDLTFKFWWARTDIFIQLLGSSSGQFILRFINVFVSCFDTFLLNFWGWIIKFDCVSWGCRLFCDKIVKIIFFDPWTGWYLLRTCIYFHSNILSWFSSISIFWFFRKIVSQVYLL